MRLLALIKNRLSSFVSENFYGKVMVFFIWASIPATFSYDLWAKEARDAADQSIVSYIQVLMSLDNTYHGDINGICNSATLLSIRSYGNKIHDVACVSSTRDELIRIVTENLGLQKSLGATETDVIRKDLKNTIDTVEKLSAMVPQHFEDQFRNLATIGVTTMITSLSIMLAGIAFLGNAFIKDQVKAAHDKEVEETKDKLSSMIDSARSEISAHTFTTIGNYCTNLYVPLPDPLGKQRYLYETYVSFAVAMTELAYKSSSHLKKLSEETPGMKLSDHQLGLIERCLNNYAYFLAERSALESNNNVDADKVRLGQLLHELQKLKATGTTELLRWNLIDTIAWVKLHIGGKEREEVKDMLRVLLSDPTVPEAWRNAAGSRYEGHEKNHASIWTS